MSLPLSGIKCPLKLKAIEVPESMKRLGEDYFDFFFFYIGGAVQGSRLPWCDGRCQGDQSSATKKICRGYNFLKSGLGQGFPVKMP
jgi:hypothetical protein